MRTLEVFKIRFWPFVRYVSLQAIICGVLTVFAGWISMKVYLWPNRVNEFAGLHLVIAGYAAPIIFLLSAPFHSAIFFLSPKPWPKSLLTTVAFVSGHFLMMIV